MDNRFPIPLIWFLIRHRHPLLCLCAYQYARRELRGKPQGNSQMLEPQLLQFLHRLGFQTGPTFNAEDPEGKSKLLLNGAPTILEPVVPGCPEFRNVSVNSEQAGTAQSNTSLISSHAPPAGTPPTSPPRPLSFLPPKYAPPAPASAPAPAPVPVPAPAPAPAPAPPMPTAPMPPAQPSSTTVASPPALSPPAAPPASPPLPLGPAPAPAPAPSPSSVPGSKSSQSDNGSIHYHYHYYQSKTPAPVHACPSGCSESALCPSSCLLHCCKRDLSDLDEYFDEDDEDAIKKRDCLCVRKCRKLGSKRKIRNMRCMLSCSRTCKDALHTRGNKAKVK
ncbi:hypothetical protein OS493_014844 [Desmophyllum pertusum]|uniref:Uncharacterized protein n=1 Tax=Desmophyllum pertusum TaxID=174260 RepID=A0A9X0CHA0_9CNID|nr:hypothetical protein OS493_014844 [Desmophyllum pertusum]